MDPDDRDETRWPASTDRAFLEVDPRDGTSAAYDTNERLYRMRRGFRLAADILVEQTEQEPSRGKDLLYPILCNYRHALELELEYVPIAFGQYVRGEIEGFRNERHDLEQLWFRYLHVFEGLSAPIQDEAIGFVEAVIREFNTIDPSAQGFASRTLQPELRFN